MEKYRIKIYYSTGDSFSTRDEIDFLEFSWEDINVAKDNLLRIKEHYEMHREINKYNSKLTKEQLFEKNKDKDWFVSVKSLFCISSGQAISEKEKKKVGQDNWEYRIDNYFAEHCLKLKTDKGNDIQISAFWCGYFENLYSAEIVLCEKNENGLKVEWF